MRFRLLCGGALLLSLATSAAAQSHPRLVAIVRLAQDGRADSARSELTQFLTTLTPGDTLLPEALYTAALVAATDEERRLTLRRVMIEHSRSSWADDAILLLGQLEYASANPGGTVTQITRLLEDYPLSPLRATAAFWGARAAADLRQGELACRWAAEGLEAAGRDVELVNQLRFQQQRCEALVAAGPDTSRARPDTARAAPPPAPPARQTGFFVQVAALPTREAADAAAAPLRRMNYATVIVPEGGLHKVRAGPFPNRADAAAALARIRSATGGSPFIVAVR